MVDRAHKHLQLPAGPDERFPIIGNEVGNASASQEFSPWYNPNTERFEALVNISSGQVFCHSVSPFGPWSVGSSAVLGGGNGGESGNAQQCRVNVEDGFLYAYYMHGGSDKSVYLARAPMPTVAAPTPLFTRLGVIATRVNDITGSNFIFRNNGRYFLYSEDTTLSVQASSAARLSGLVESPFAVVQRDLPVRMYYGSQVSADPSQVRQWNGRPFIVRETDAWVMYLHNGIGSDAVCHVTRWVSYDAGDYPVNWVQDKVFGLHRPMHQAEIDQVVDFVCCQGPKGNWYAFWTAADNQSIRFTIMVAAMREPVMAFNGTDWDVVLNAPDPRADLGYKKIDYVSAGTYQASNGEDVVIDTASQAGTVVFPRAAGHARLKITNAPSALSRNDVKLSVGAASDIICGGNPITAMSASGTTVTVTTRRPHGLSTSDFVTVSGCTPAAYNVNGAAVASVPAANQFTYVAGSAPGTNTVIGAFDWSVATGESRRYKVRQFHVPFWVRD